MTHDYLVTATLNFVWTPWMEGEASSLQFILLTDCYIVEVSIYRKRAGSFIILWLLWLVQIES